jgi:hypothetical protein
MKVARWLVAMGCLLLFFGGLLHSYGSAFVFRKLAASNLDGGLVGAMKGLWCSLSVESIVLSCVIFWASRLPNGRGLILLCTLIPALTAILLYHFVGAFIGAHVFAAATVCLAIGGWLMPRGHESHPASRVW